MSKKILMLCGDYGEDYETMVPFQTLLAVGRNHHFRKAEHRTASTLLHANDGAGAGQPGCTANLYALAERVQRDGRGTLDGQSGGDERCAGLGQIQLLLHLVAAHAFQ